MANAKEFVEKIKKNKAFREKILPKLEDIKEGDWKAITAIAKEDGYTFSVADLIKVVPENFYKGNGKNPDAGWDPKFVKKATVTKKKAAKKKA